MSLGVLQLGTEVRDRKLLSQSPCQVYCTKFVETSQDTGTSDTTEDIGTSSLHQGHETFTLDNLNSTVHWTLVFDGGTGRHHHSPTHGVNGVGHQTGKDGNTPSQQERPKDRCICSQKNWLQGIVETEIHATIDKDTDAGDGETTVKTLDTVRLQGFGVDIDQAVELTFTSLAFSVVSQSGTSEIKGVDQGEGEGSGQTSGSDFESSFDGILKGKVKGLCGEISQHIGQVTSPEWKDTLAFQGFLDTINDTLVWFSQTALFNHLILILNQEFDSFNGGGGS